MDLLIQIIHLVLELTTTLSWSFPVSVCDGQQFTLSWSFPVHVCRWSTVHWEDIALSFINNVAPELCVCVCVRAHVHVRVRVCVLACMCVSVISLPSFIVNRWLCLLYKILDIP